VRDVLHLAVLNLKRRSRRSLFTTVGVALAAAVYLALVASGRGLETEFQSTVNELGSDVTVQSAGSALPLTSRLDPGQVADLRELESVVGAVEIVIGVARAAEAPQLVVVGTDTKGRLGNGIRTLAGRALERDRQEMMVGRSAAKRLDLEPGNRVEIMGRHRFTVVGIYETGHGLYDNACLTDKRAAQRVFRTGDFVNLVMLDLAPGRSPDEVAAAIRERWPELEASPSNLWISTYQQVDVVTRFARYLAMVGLMVAALGVANTLNMNVAERASEIGILRAVGWRRWRIVGVVMSEGLVLTTIGGVLGLPLSVALLKVLRQVADLGVVPVAPDILTTVEGLVAVGAAGLAGSVPALVAVLRLRPAAALRDV